MLTHNGQTYRVLDFHTHFAGDVTKFDPTIAAIFERIRPKQQRFFSQRDVGRHAGSLLAYLDRSGIDQACLLAEEGPPTNYSVPTELCLGFAAQAPERLFVIGNVNPRLEAQLEARVKLLIRAGVRAFKLYGSDHRQDPFDPKLGPLFAACAEHELPIMFHCGKASRYPMSHPEYGDPLYWEPLFEQYPQISFVLAHGGKGGQHEECLRILREHPNTYVETSDIPFSVLRRLISDDLGDRFIFGTDMPQFLDYAPLVHKVLRLPLSAQTRRAVLYDNGARLLRFLLPVQS